MTTSQQNTFDGIHFDDRRSYSPPDAKVFLEQAFDAIRASERLPGIGVDATRPGRKRIGEKEFDVWNCVELRGSSGAFNEQPHFTLALRREGVLAVLIVPNEWLKPASNRRTIEQLGYNGFRDVIEQVTRRVIAVLRPSLHARPWILVQHRRATVGQKLNVCDGRLEFDPQAEFGPLADLPGNPIKKQSAWLEATYRTMTGTYVANIEPCFGALMQYEHPPVRTPQLADLVIDVWGACLPLVDALCPR